MRLPLRPARLGWLVAVSVGVTLSSCGSSRSADDDDDDASNGGEAGGGSAGRGGKGGSSGSKASGGDAGASGEGGEQTNAGDGGSEGGDAGSGATAGRGGQPNGGRGGAGGSAGRGGGAGQGGGGAGSGNAAGTAGKGGAAGSAGAAGNGGSGGGSSGIVTFLWGEFRSSLTDSTRYVFPQVSLAGAGASRLVVVMAHAATNVVASFDAVSVGGVAAQKVASVGEDVMPSAPTAFFVVRMPAGDTADIQLDLSATAVRAAIAVYALYGVDSAVPFDSGIATGTGGATIPIDVPAGGVVLASLGMADASVADAGWSLGFFEIYDTVLVEGTPTHVAGALRVPAQADESVDVEIFTSGTAYATRAVAISLR